MLVGTKGKYFIAGFVFGISFPVVAIIIELVRLNQAFSLQAILDLHTLNPLLYIIDTAPVFLGFFAYLGGVNMFKAEKINNQLELRSKELKDLANYRQEFLANMSHEIRTPMNGVVGVVEQLKDSELNDRQMHLISIMEQSSENLLEIINNILDLSKLEVGKMSLKPEPTTINSFIDYVKVLYSKILIDKGIESRFEISDELKSKTFLVDRKKLIQAVSNFYNNAVKFTEQGSITLKSYLANDRLRIEVKDTGEGISKENQSKLFKKFSQIDSSNTKKFKGTGLGLNISQELIELMNGSVGVESESGKGSTFWIEIPFDETHEELSTKNTDRKKLDYTILSDKKVLIVEDNEINVKVMSLILQSKRMQVTSQKNGKDGVDDILRNKYDMVFMDIQMPVMDGEEAMKKLLKSGRSLPPVYAVTANAMEGDKEKYISKGFSGYIAKPYRKDIILRDLAVFFANDSK